MLTDIENDPPNENARTVTRGEQFDPNYSKPYIATIVGAIIIIAGFFDNFVNRADMSERNLALYWWLWICIRLAAAAWCVYLAKTQNRNMLAWGLFGLVIPGLALIFIGLQEKRRRNHYLDPVFDFEERHLYKNIIIKRTTEGQELKIHSSLPVGFTVGDIVSIDDQPAPTGKYQLGWNNYLTVENGRILSL